MQCDGERSHGSMFSVKRFTIIVVLAHGSRALPQMTHTRSVIAELNVKEITPNHTQISYNLAHYDIAQVSCYEQFYFQANDELD